MGEPNVSMVQAIAEAIWDKKGFEVSAYAVGDVLDYTDCMVIASAGSDRQTLAIADSVEQVMKERYSEKPMGREGRSNARWVLLDFSDVVVHVFHRPVRDYYELDRLYGDVPRVPLEEPAWVTDFSDPATEWATATDYDLPEWGDETDGELDGDAGQGADAAEVAAAAAASDEAEGVAAADPSDEADSSDPDAPAATPAETPDA